MKLMQNEWIACITVYFLTVLAVFPIGKLGWKIGAVDVPRDARRMHRVPVPRCGGLAILGAFLIGCICFGEWSQSLFRVLFGACMMTVVGLVDDVRSVPPLGKLLVQTVAAAVACLPISPFFAFSVFWIVALANAHNLIDGIDGLLAGCAVVECVALGVVLWSMGRGQESLFALLLGSACLGFRHFNRHPARIFAGDCGSGTVGYLLGVLSLPLFWEMRWSAGWLSPLFIFAYPLTDLSLAVLRRSINGKNPFCADRAHLHHRICAMGVGQRACGRILILISTVFSCVGICLCSGTVLLAASVSCLLAALFLVEIRLWLAEGNEK